MTSEGKEPTTMIPIGTIVKPSEYALRPLRDWWLGCGREPHKSNAKDAYENRKAIRGEVTEHLENGIAVRTTDGYLHKSLDYMWERAEQVSGPSNTTN